MNNQEKQLEAIQATFEKEVAKAQPHELDEHIAIYNEKMTIIGYWNIRCYEELRKILQNPCNHPLDCQFPNCKCNK